MNDFLLSTEGNSASNSFADLLSVDADAHLQKLAACMFPSPAQLPVELVRASLKRGASTVDVQVRNRYLTISDNGDGISSSQWLSLACAFDCGRNATDREKAIAALQSESSPGIGLLAVSIPGNLGIKIESSGSEGKGTMHIESGHMRQLDSSAWILGTRISISRSRGPAEAEKKLIRELCAAVPQDIMLNGNKLEKKSLLRKPLAQREIDLSPGCNQASIAIPSRGDVCRIWLLDQGIPWQAFTSASYHGLVFEAALESGSPPSASCFSILAKAAGQLYLWLAAHYMSFPEKYQERIEELIFKKERLYGDLQLFSAFSPFRLWRSKRRLNLEELRRKAENETLYALPLGSDPSLVLSRHEQALLLTPLQKDFLLNHLHLPLVEPAVHMETVGKLNGRFSFYLRKMIRLAAALPQRLVKILPPDQMDNEEKYLCRELMNHWQHRQLGDTPGRPSIPLTVVMVGGRGLAPAFWLHAGQGRVLHIRRRHPLIRQALCCVRRDPANSELIFAALAPDIFDSRRLLF
ncbi:MAG: hypothetical protein IH584_02865 [Candidatus Aminicenantes bacterium]|nr:hypothetical protein [Candidatus Aminicenantes bacterium]